MTETEMAKISLAKLEVAALLKLRDDVSTALSRRAHELEGQLARLGADVGGRGRRGGQVSSLKGLKVAPKYRDPKTGDTWAGRGAKPRWLVARIKEGKKLQDFQIEKSAKKARKAAKKRRRSK
jgi:DNA-binding protein H-NS